MPLELGIWRIDGETRRLVPARMEREEPFRLRHKYTLDPLTERFGLEA